MNRRAFIRASLISSTALAIPAFAQSRATKNVGHVMTVNGFLDASEMGMTLTHEHLFADLRSFEEQRRQTLELDVDEIIEVVLPHLERARSLGCRTLIDCTATHLGRSPALLRRLSAASGLNVLTVTGSYLAANGHFVPDYAKAETVDQLARRWIGEWQGGIEDTGVRPGLIKLGMNGGPLTSLEEKVFRAAVETHRETGLTIGTHIGPWGEPEPGFCGASASQMLAVLEKAQVSPSAWIWFHAQNEKDPSHHVRAAKIGAWVSFDGLSPETLAEHIELVKRLRTHELLNRVLVSHDAGWYTAGEPRGGNFRTFDTVFTEFIPALRADGFKEDEITQLFVRNPAEAFAIRKRTT